MPELWYPGLAGPHTDFVERLHRQIEAFTEEHGVERAAVVVELVDGLRIPLDAVRPEPGYGFITLQPHPEAEGDLPEQLIVPIASVRRIELSRAEERRERFGFSVPES